MTATKSDDSSRAGEILADDEASFRRLFAHNYRPLVRFFVHRGFSHEESEDLIQDTFLRAYRGMAHFRGDSSSARTWLLKIATNVGLNAIRHRSTKKRTYLTVALEGMLRDPRGATTEAVEEQLDTVERPRGAAIGAQGPAQAEQALAWERARLLREAMSSLPPQMSRCVALRVIQDLKYREIADIMQISVDTVKSQLHQARDRLKERLADYFSDIEFG